MIDEFAVKFATEYLDKQFAKGESVDLVGMPNHVDYFERVTQAVAGGQICRVCWMESAGAGHASVRGHRSALHDDLS